MIKLLKNQCPFYSFRISPEWHLLKLFHGSFNTARPVILKPQAKDLKAVPWQGLKILRKKPLRMTVTAVILNKVKNPITVDLVSSKEQKNTASGTSTAVILKAKDLKAARLAKF